MTSTFNISSSLFAFDLPSLTSFDFPHFDLAISFWSKSLFSFFSSPSSWLVLPLFNLPLLVWSQFVVALALAILIYRLCLRPLKYSRELGSVQFGQVWKQLQAPGAKMLSRGRRIGNFPPPYPNGWFVISYSWELKPGQVRLVNALGWI